jgi:hypothetical protein
MKSMIRLFLILATGVTFFMAWITGQFGKPGIRLLIAVLAASTLAVFFLLNLLEHREEMKRERKRKEAVKATGNSAVPYQGKRAQTSFSLKERKSGLTWGGGNIKASEATRGTRRKFLGR